MNANVSILIPCLNEVVTIRKAVESSRFAAGKYLHGKFEIIVADNGSSDGTLEILNSLKYVRIINVPIKGYGAAMHYGIMSAKFPNVFFADADLSYSFMDLEKFMPSLGKFDMILGSRIKGNIHPGAMPQLNRYLGTPLLTLLIKLVYGINVTDCNSGMRMVKKEFYKTLHMKNSGMEWASELLVKTALRKGSYKEVPITFMKDQREAETHLKRWEDGWRHLKVIILLKPRIFLYGAGVLLISSLAFISSSPFTSIALFLFAEFLFFACLAAVCLSSAIDKKMSSVVLLLQRIPFVFLGILMSFFGFISLFFISDDHLFTKYIIVFQIVLYDLWLFFYETIRTHLVNSMPEQI